MWPAFRPARIPIRFSLLWKEPPMTYLEEYAPALVAEMLDLAELL